MELHALTLAACSYALLLLQITISFSKKLSLVHVCTDMINNLLAGEVIEVTSSYGATLTCTFLSGFTGSAHCTVQYGTDPTYMNLPYSAKSNETGRAGDSIIVVMREQLKSSTVYYYTASAESGGATVIVQGTFTTPQYSKYYML